MYPMSRPHFWQKINIKNFCCHHLWENCSVVSSGVVDIIGVAVVDSGVVVVSSGVVAPPWDVATKKLIW